MKYVFAISDLNTRYEVSFVVDIMKGIKHFMAMVRMAKKEMKDAGHTPSYFISFDTYTFGRIEELDETLFPLIKNFNKPQL